MDIDEEDDHGPLGGIRSLFGGFPELFFINHEDDVKNENDRQLASPIDDLMMEGDFDDFDDFDYGDGDSGVLASMDAVGPPLGGKGSNADSVDQGMEGMYISTEDRPAATTAAKKAVRSSSYTTRQRRHGTPSAATAAIWQYQADKKKYTVSPEQIDRLIATEMNSLPAQEREAIVEDLHGLPPTRALEETPEQVRRALQEFEAKVRSQQNAELQRGHLRAMELNSRYVIQDSFRLKFLRAEFFDTTKAVARYCSNLNMLLDLYGDFALTRQLYMKDLGKTVLPYLRRGAIQILPTRDRSGRRIITVVGGFGEGYNAEIHARLMLYLNGLVSDDIHTQKRGLAVVICPTLDMASVCTPQMERFESRLAASMPLRRSACHLCLPNAPLFVTLKALVLTVAGPAMRQVTRVHLGRNLECNYSLVSFGIVPEALPRSSTGNLKTTQWHQWIKTRKTIETEYLQKGIDFSTVGIECPDDRSIVIRHGGKSFENAPNQVLRDILQAKEAQWRLASRRSAEKKQIILGVISEAHELGFKFLLWEGRWYTEENNPEVLYKYVSQAMRDQVKRTDHEQISDGDSGSDSNTKAYLFVHSRDPKRHRTECGCGI